MKIFLLNLLLLISFTGKGQDVYKTPSGKKYHLASCRMVNNISEKISVNHAVELGLTPCKICNPSTIGNAANFISKIPKGESNTVQCKGITKAGTRCRHMTAIANGYCFQHNPDK